MKVKDLMSRDVECTHPDATLKDAATRMRELNVGMLPVCGDNDRILGALTDRDITIRAVAQGQDPTRTRAADVMTSSIVYCYDDDDAKDAADLMKEHQIRRLVVLNRDRRLIGIMSLGDLAVETGDSKLSGDALERISEPVHPKRAAG